MNLLCKIFSGSYDNLWKAIIRPTRDKYTMKDLGPYKFEINSKNYKRTDLTITNKHNIKLKCSFWEPFDEEREYDQLPCVIYLHGNSSSRTEAIGQLKHLLPLNITVFAFDFYGCGKSEGKYISLGWYESDDVECVINYLKKTNKVNSIGLWGRSMGAVTALIYSSRDKNNLSAIVLDSAFYSLKKLIEELIEESIKIPNFIVNSMVKTLQNTILEKANFDINDIEPYLFAQKCSVPAFFCHGKDDSLINPHHCQDLYDIYPYKKKIAYLNGDHNTTRTDEFKKSAALFFYHYLNLKELKSTKKIKSNSSLNIFEKRKSHSNIFNRSILTKKNNEESFKDSVSEKNEDEKEDLTSDRNNNYFQNCFSNDLKKINTENKKIILSKENKEILKMEHNFSNKNLDKTQNRNLKPIELNIIKKLRTNSTIHNVYFKKNIHNPFSKTDTKIKPIVNNCNLINEMKLIKNKLNFNNRYKNNDIPQNSNKENRNNLLSIEISKNDNKNSYTINNYADTSNRKDLRKINIDKKDKAIDNKKNSIKYEKNPFLFKLSQKKNIENEKQQQKSLIQNNLSNNISYNNCERKSNMEKKWVIFEGINPFLNENKDYFKNKILKKETSSIDDITIKSDDTLIENNEEIIGRNPLK